MKPIYKKVLIGFAIVLGIYALTIIGVVVNSEYKKYQEKRAVQKWEETLRKPYKEDIYGGKTPEETWQMFLEALKKGDVELASKYFAVEKQGEWKKNLIKIKEENKVNEIIKELETLRINKEENINKDKAYYYITTKTKELGIFSSSVIFYLNPHTRVWKILVL